MRKFLMLFLLSVCFCAAQAQDTTLKEYVGKYIFPDGSYVPTAEVTLKDTVLNINSIQGSSDLSKQAKDTFSLLTYNGTAYFKRDSTGKVAGIKVEVEDILLEGVRETAMQQQKQPANRTKKTAAE